MQVWRRVSLGLVGGLLLVSSGFAQDPNATPAAVAVATQAADAQERLAAAEAILAAREAASGRELDPAYRAATRTLLARRTLKELEALQAGTDIVGNDLVQASQQQELVFTPVTPCRIIDTRTSVGAIAAGSTRDFYVATTNYSSQGGSSTTCGIPFGPTTAAVIDFVAVNPAGAGNLRVTPYGTTMPTASIINYAAVPGLNVANGLVVPICNPGATTCTRDIRVQADVSAVQVVADVLGYFSRKDAAVMVDLVAKSSQTINASGFTELMASTLFLPDKCYGVNDSWTVLVSASGYLASASATGTLARLGLSVDNATDIEVGTLTNATLGPGDDNNEVWHVQWVFTGLISGTHVFRTLAEEYLGGQSYAAYWNRMVVQVLGNTCP